MTEARSYSLEFTNHHQILDIDHSEWLISVPAEWRPANTRLITKALSQDVMLLAFVPSPLRSRFFSVTLTSSRIEDQLIYGIHPNINVYRYALQISCNLVITRSASSHE